MSIMDDEEFKETLLDHLKRSGDVATEVYNQLDGFGKQLESHDERTKKTSEKVNDLHEKITRMDERQLLEHKTITRIGEKTDKTSETVERLKQHNIDQDARIDTTIVTGTGKEYAIQAGTMKWLAILVLGVVLVLFFALQPEHAGEMGKTVKEIVR